jgi:hypothetical protein
MGPDSTVDPTDDPRGETGSLPLTPSLGGPG